MEIEQMKAISSAFPRLDFNTTRFLLSRLLPKLSGFEVDYVTLALVRLPDIIEVVAAAQSYEDKIHGSTEIDMMTNWGPVFRALDRLKNS